VTIQPKALSQQDALRLKQYLNESLSDVLELFPGRAARQEAAFEMRRHADRIIEEEFPGARADDEFLAQGTPTGGTPALPDEDLG
jgi:hypothetical protein